MKRRLFSALFASAPALAIPVPPPATAPGPANMTGLLGANKVSEYIPSPLEILQNKNRQKYYRAKEAANNLFYQHIQRSTHAQFNHNINALRSVSAQHKAHMVVRWEESLKEENKTWLEKLAAQFGVEEKEDGVYSATSPKSRY